MRALTVLLFLWCSLAFSQDIVLTTPAGGTFALPTTDGFLTSERLLGKHVFIFFGFTHCPEVCPLTLQRMAQLAKKMTPSERANFRFLFVSVDNERDSIESLKKLQARYGSAYIGATADDETLTKLATSFGARYRRFKTQKNIPVVDHTDSVFHIDQQGRWVNTFPHGTSVVEFLKALRLNERVVTLPSHPARRAKLLGKTQCDLSQDTCRISVGKEKFELSFSPRPISVEQAFTIQLKTNAKRLTPTEIDFEGIDLNMGYLRPALALKGAGIYQASLRLPVCELPRMKWRVRLIVKHADGELGHLDYALTTVE